MSPFTLDLGGECSSEKCFSSPHPPPPPPLCYISHLYFFPLQVISDSKIFSNQKDISQMIFPQTSKFSNGFHRMTYLLMTTPEPSYHTQATTAYMKQLSMVCHWFVCQFLLTSIVTASKLNRLAWQLVLI